MLFNKTSPQTINKWSVEKILPDGDAFFNSSLDGIKNARQSVTLEMYIFQDDDIGHRFEDALIDATKRNVKVRVMVDGIGSRGWIYTIGKRLKAAGVEIKVFHQLPWERFFSPEQFHSDHSWVTLFGLINRRNHRKLCIIDEKTAWIGSMNIWNVCSHELTHNTAWRELGIEVQGEEVKFLNAAFDLSWFPWFHRYKKLLRHSRRIVKNSKNSSVRLNNTLRLRRYHKRALLSKFKKASKRIWIAAAYFVPSGEIIRAIKSATRRGIDVRIIMSMNSDIFFMPWIAADFQATLLDAGIKIYLYKPSPFHAKYMIIDDSFMIGSSNLNQRSLLHDLEVDISSSNPESLAFLTKEFENDIASSYKLSKEDLRKRPWWQKLSGRLALLFKYFL